MILVGILLWLAGSFMVCDIMERIAGVSYIPFAQTIPFRLLFGLPILIAVTLWYRLIVAKEEALNREFEKELIVHQVTEQQAEPPVELIDRITVKDGSRIHLVKSDDKPRQVSNGRQPSNRCYSVYQSGNIAGSCVSTHQGNLAGNQNQRQHQHRNPAKRIIYNRMCFHRLTFHFQTAERDLAPNY